MTTDPARPLRRRLGAAALALLLLGGSAGLVGCSGSDEPADPAAERRERVQDRLRSSFPRVQADCILDRLDTAGLQAIDGTKDLPADGDAVAAYTEAVTACVLDTDGDDVASTTTAPPPAATSTTAGG